MHWTLQVLFALCAACALFNALRWLTGGTVRVAGMLVCGAWAVQQAYWMAAGTDSLALILACDVLLLAWFFDRRAENNPADWAIAALIPVTMLIYVPAAFYGQTVAGWWTNWAIVAFQMLLGLPVARKRPFWSASHGGA